MPKLLTKLHCVDSQVGGVGRWVVAFTENKATQPSLAGAWAELGNI